MLFRVDAGAGIGLGHFVRCRTLAEASRARCTFLTRWPDAIMDGAAGHDVIALDAEPGSVADADETTRVARRLDERTVVIDGYVFDAAYAARLAVERALWIDDAGFSDVRSGWVLNHNAYARPGAYPGMRVDRLLLGPPFALVRRAIAGAREPVRTPRDLATRVLVTMGGSDPPDATTTALDALELLSESRALAVRCLLGAANPRRTALAQRCSDAVVGSEDVAPHMLWSDVAISAAGGTCMELACLGVPTIALAIADNQRPVASTLGSLGLAIDAGSHRDLAPARLAAMVAALMDDRDQRARMIARQRELVDGSGPTRVMERLSVEGGARP